MTFRRDVFWALFQSIVWRRAKVASWSARLIGIVELMDCSGQIFPPEEALTTFLRDLFLLFVGAIPEDDNRAPATKETGGIGVMAAALLSVKELGSPS
jgi:hypothetical protein